jgi:hypothetical protein
VSVRDELSPRRHGERNLTPAALIGAGVLLAVAAGAGTPRLGVVPLAACGTLALAAGVALAARRFGAGVIVGLLILGCVDALPGPNVETFHVVRTIELSDVLTLVLMAALLWIALVVPEARRRPSGHQVALRLWASLLLAFWLAAGIRAWIQHGVPISNALFWGRQFAYLALLAPLFVPAFSVVRLRRTALATCAIGICVAGAAQVATVASGHTLSAFVHLTRVANTEGLVRLYSGADWLIPAGVPFGLGLVLFSTVRRLRIAGAVVLAFSFAAFAVELTRALYIGIVIGLAFTTALWLIVGDAAGRIGRRRSLGVGAILAAMIAALVLFKPAVISGSVVNGVVVRATSVFSDLSGGSTQDPDLAVRVFERQDLTYYLGSSWLFGKGLLDPSFYYVAQAPSGSIQNPDVGYLSSVMTIGVLGTLVVYIPFIYFTVLLIYLRVRRRTATTSWLAYGCLAWLFMAQIASVTLAMMLNSVGAIPCAAVLALACVAATRTQPDGLGPPRIARLA